MENPSFELEEVIPSFVEQYKNPNILCDEIRSNLNLSGNEYNKVRKEAIRRCLITGEERNKKVITPKYYHYSERYGKWFITKQINGMKKYFFSCKTEEEAILLWDALIEADWDKTKVDKKNINKL